MNADVKQITIVSAHVKTSGWGKVLLKSVCSLPQMLNQKMAKVYNTCTNKCLELTYVFVFIKQTQLYIKTSVLYLGCKQITTHDKMK